jgi:hypothetical protein
MKWRIDMQGTVARIVADRGFGFIEGDDGQEYFKRWRQCGRLQRATARAADHRQLSNPRARFRLSRGSFERAGARARRLTRIACRLRTNRDGNVCSVGYPRRQQPHLPQRQIVVPPEQAGTGGLAGSPNTSASIPVQQSLAPPVQRAPAPPPAPRAPARGGGGHGRAH